MKEIVYMLPKPCRASIEDYFNARAFPDRSPIPCQNVWTKRLDAQHARELKEQSKKEKRNA